MGIANNHAQAATRNNLFGFQPNVPSLFEDGGETSHQWLEHLGFSVIKVDQQHWVVTHHTALPELHFYSARELAQFASYKAPHYAKRLLAENRT